MIFQIARVVATVRTLCLDLSLQTSRTFSTVSSVIREDFSEYSQSSTALVSVKLSTTSSIRFKLGVCLLNSARNLRLTVVSDLDLAMNRTIFILIAKGTDISSET